MSDSDRANSRLFLIVFLSALAAFGPIVTDFYLPALPAQAEEFGASASLVQLGLSATMWGLAAGQLFFGPLSDKKGRKGPLAASLVLFTASAVASAFAPDIHTFIALRFLQGLGAAGGLVMSRSIAADRYSGRELGRFMGAMGAVHGIAPITAPLAGAFLLGWGGWRGIFLLIGAIGAILLAATLFSLAETRPEKMRSAAPGRSSEDLKLLARDPVFVGITLQQILASTVLFAHIAGSPFIFQTHFGLSPEAYGIAFGIMAFGITTGAVTSPRMKPATALLAGSVGMLAAGATTGLLFLVDAPLAAVGPCFFLMLASLGLTLPAAMTVALTRHRARSGSAAAVLGAVSFVGGGLVAPATTLVTPTLAVSAIFTVSAFALLLLSLWLRPHLAAHAEALEGEPVETR